MFFWCPWDQGASNSPSLPFPCPQLLEDLEEQLHCSAFEEAALTRRICSELQFFPVGRVGVAWLQD